MQEKTSAEVKALLRKEFLERRDRLPMDVRESANEQIGRGLLEFIHRGKSNAHANPASVQDKSTSGTARTVALYRPIRGEVDVWPCANALWNDGWRVAVPVTLPGRLGEKRMNFVEVSASTEWVRGMYGILTPDLSSVHTVVSQADIATVVVPGVAFTKDGWRLGYGGGYYDRWFQGTTSRPACIGVAYQCQLASELPVEAHDVPMDAVMTECGLTVCGSKL